MDPNIPAKQMAARHVPEARKEPFKRALEKLEKDGIIQALDTDELSPWCGSFVLVSKKDKNEVRICLDNTHLNRAIIRPVHRTQLTEEVASQLQNSK